MAHWSRKIFAACSSCLGDANWRPTGNIFLQASLNDCKSRVPVSLSMSLTLGALEAISSASPSVTQSLFSRSWLTASCVRLALASSISWSRNSGTQMVRGREGSIVNQVGVNKWAGRMAEEVRQTKRNDHRNHGQAVKDCGVGERGGVWGLVGVNMFEKGRLIACR